LHNSAGFGPREPRSLADQLSPGRNEHFEVALSPEPALDHCRAACDAGDGLAVDLDRKRASPLERGPVEEIRNQPVPKAGDDLKVTRIAEVALDQRRPGGVGRACQFGGPMPGEPGLVIGVEEMGQLVRNRDEQFEVALFPEPALDKISAMGLGLNLSGSSAESVYDSRMRIVSALGG
jgi:hypothetical protein